MEARPLLPPDESLPGDPAAAPLSPRLDRRLVPRDLLEVTVFEAPELSGEARISETGEISLPLLGAIPAAGRTPGELEVALVDRLRGSYMHDPHVSVRVSKEAEQPIYVLGEVNQPGAYGTSGGDGLTLLRAISVAGGLKSGAAAGRTLVIRTRPDGTRLQVPVDLGEVLSARAPDVLLQVNDVVYIPTDRARAITLGTIDALVRLLTFRPAF